MMRLRCRHAAVLWLALPISACIDEPCDPGMMAIRGSCFPEDDGTPEPDASEDDADDADDPMDESGGSGMDSESIEFGAVCTVDADCAGGGVCISTPVDVGCSQTDCRTGEANEDACPDGWMCLGDARGSACIKF